MSIGEWVILGVLGPVDVVFLYYLWRYRKSIDTMLSTGINRWLLARHKPEDIGDPGDPKQYCFTCRKSWPCAEWEKLHEQVSGIQQAAEEAQR